MTGQPDEIIRSIRPEWTQVLDRMILVNLHVGRWRAATRSEFSEFGLDADMFSAYTAGARSLLPRRIQQELQTLERMARDLLVRLSYKTLFGYLMPKEQYEEFKRLIHEAPISDLRRYLHSKTDGPAEWREASLSERWFALADMIAGARDDIVDEVVEAYRPSAIVRWRIENRLPKDGDVEPPDEWLDEILTDMVRRIPTADDIRQSFVLDIAPAFIEAPDEAVKATRLEEIARQEAEVQRRLDAIDTAKIREAQAAARAEERIQDNRVREELAREREQTRLALQADKERLERERRITEEIIAHEKKLRQERIETTLDEVAGQLHQLVYGAIINGLEQLDDKKRVHPRWVGRVKSLVDQVRRLNFTDDDELERVCGELEALAESNAASPDSAARVRDVLVDVGISLKADLVAGGIQSRSARDLGIPDRPAPDLVRQARRQARDLEEDVQPELAGLERAPRTL